MPKFGCVRIQIGDRQSPLLEKLPLHEVRDRVTELVRSPAFGPNPHPPHSSSDSMSHFRLLTHRALAAAAFFPFLFQASAAEEKSAPGARSSSSGYIKYWP